MREQPMAKTVTMEQPGLLSLARASRPRPLRTAGLGRRASWVFVAAAAIGLAGFGTWAATTELSAVTRATGTVVPPVKNQIVQHLEGGIVAEIMVREGDTVQSGEPLLRLEDSRWTAGLAQSEIELLALKVTRARLAAEATGQDKLVLPESLSSAPMAQAERALFDQRHQTLTERAEIFADQVRRLQLERVALRQRRESIEAERKLVRERVASLSRLAKRKAVSRNELLTAMASLQQLETKVTDIETKLPQIAAELSETERRQAEIFTAARAEAAEKRTETELEIAKLTESIASLRDRDSRSDVRSPVTGVVNKLFVSTLGGIVAPGQEIAEIVPEGEALTVDAKLAPSDRGRVWPGMDAVLKITAYDYSIHGGLAAVVEDISADAIADEKGERYFRVQLRAEKAEFGAEHPILPGMVAEVDMLAQRRTILAYLLKPLTQIRDKAFRE